MCKRFIFGLVICVFFAEFAFADRRSYVWTYEYQTMPKGRWEVEYYLTTEVPDINRSNINTLKQWVELEYGITDRFDVALYQMWKFKNKRFENDSEYEGFKLRGRWRFGEKGKFIVDPLVYLEYIRDDDFHKPGVVEAKLILAKDIGNFNVSYNQIFKRNLDRRGISEHEYAFGLNYAFDPRFKFGLESKGNYSKDKYYAGPTFSIAAKKFWVSSGAAFGLNERSDDIQIRMLIGIPF